MLEPSAPDRRFESSEHEQFDIWHEVPLVPQLTGMSCWAAAAAMIVGWRDCIDIDPEQVARGSGHWEAYRDGLEPEDVDALAAAWDLAIETPRSYDVAALRSLLHRCGPLWVGEASGGLHVVVVAGMHGDGTLDGTFVRVLDPWPEGRGERYTISFHELARNLEAANGITQMRAHVLHARGRQPGAVRFYHERRDFHASYGHASYGAGQRLERDATSGVRYGTPFALFERMRTAPPDAFAWDGAARGAASADGLPPPSRAAEPARAAMRNGSPAAWPASTSVVGEAGEASIGVYLDPGHGGAHDLGHSSAHGGRGPAGTLEKDVTLRIARCVRAHLGAGTMLSRDGDYNLSLRERLDSACESGAPVFVSIHANHGAVEQRGSEVWVYGARDSDADQQSLALAQAIGAELRALGGDAPRLGVGQLAVLHPEQHAPGVAACLIEADYLSHPEGEARLSDANAVDAIAAAIARGVCRYCAARSESTPG